MANEESFNVSMSLRSRRHPAAAVACPSAKPKGGARLLSILLRLIVMHIVLTFFLLFAGIAVSILILLCIAGKLLRHRRRLRDSRRQHPAAERCGLSRDETRCLPCFRCSDSVSDDCSICLEGFRKGDWLRVLPGCKHLFHRICVDRWLERSRVCPICRGGVAAGWI